jgi:hypothetical protein
MTSTKLLRVKLPLRLLNAMPGKREERNRFIVSALSEKISQRQAAKRQPVSREER